ncbi:MAG: hypothetical protein DIU71_18910, partial [Proteobacteria bacterium]
ALIGGDARIRADIGAGGIGHLWIVALVIAADAGAHGDGGRIIVWSDEVTRFDGHLSARGGTSSGDGGFAEISGKQSLILTGTADLNAPHGGRGTLLLDPEWIRIIDSDLAPPAADDGEYEFEEDEYVSAVVGNRAIERLLENGNVVLQASMDIIQDADAHIDVSGVEGATGRALTLEAGRDITLNGNITLREGALTLHAVQDITLAGTVTTGGGVTLEAGRTIDMQGGTILAGSSAVDLEADEEITLGLITTSGDVTLAAGGAITAGSGSEIRGDTLMITGASIGSDAARLNTSVEVLSATASTGGIYITEQDGLRLQNLRADAGDVRITSTAGDIEVGEIDAVNVALDAAAGAIRDDDNDATRISASGGIALSAHTGIGTVADFSADDDAAVGSALGVSTSGTLSAEVASATGQIHLDIAGAPLVGAGALRLGDGSASAGTIVLRSGGDLNLGGLSAGALAIGSANTTRVGLRSGGGLTLPAGGLAYHAPAQLLVRGATDVVGAGATRT